MNAEKLVNYQGKLQQKVEDQLYNKVWYKNKKNHRDGDLPAYITPTLKAWFRNGINYRSDEKPAVLDGFQPERQPRKDKVFTVVDDIR